MSRSSKLGTRMMAFAAVMLISGTSMAQFPPGGEEGGQDRPRPERGQGRPGGRFGGGGEGGPGRFGEGPGGPGGPGGRMGMPPNPVVSALDTDADGEISEKELAAATTSLKTLDKNKDGKLSQDELRPNFGGMRGGPGGANPAAVNDVVNRLLASDKDKDGKLSRTELPARMKTLMDRADTNKDKFLDKAELTKYAENQVRSQNPGGFGGEGGRGRGGRGGFGGPPPGGEGFGPPPGGEGFGGPPPGGGRPPGPDGPDR